MIKLKDLLETIKAEEAYRDDAAIQTVVDGKRDLGFLTVKGSVVDEADIWKAIKAGGLKTIKVPGNQFEAYIYFRPGAEQKANELKKIAMKYGGFLSYEATEDETRRIGELLGYEKSDIDAYINKNYR
jgi:hypothetical protein